MDSASKLVSVVDDVVDQLGVHYFQTYDKQLVKVSCVLYMCYKYVHTCWFNMVVTIGELVVLLLLCTCQS